MALLVESRYERPSNRMPKVVSPCRAEKDCLKAKLQLGLLEHRSVDTHFAMMFVRWRSPAHDMLLSTAMPVPLVCAVSAAMAEVIAWGKRAVGPLNLFRSSQKRESLIGGRCGCRVSEIDVMLSAMGVGGLRPVTPGVLI